MNEYVLKLLFSRKMKIQTRKNCQYKVIRITKMKYIDNTKCWQNCGALGGTQVLSTAPSGNVFLTISNYVLCLFDQEVPLQAVFPT